MGIRAARLVLVASLVLAGAASAAAAQTALSGKITVSSTETLTATDVTNGGVSGRGRFRISGVIQDHGRVTDYRRVKGGYALVRRVVAGQRGTITFLISIHLGSPAPAPWKITAATKAYAGLHGKGTQVVDNFSSTPATFVLKGTVSPG